MNPNPKSMLIVLGIPLLALTAGVLFLGGSTATIFSVPVLFVFVFALFPVTTALMAIAWRLYDRDADYEEDSAAAPSEATK
jgi:4-hydroxybenzoate polyprenyltransferase